MKKHLLFLLSLATAAFAVSCGSDKKAGNNWLAEDDVNVAFDETFRPIMQEEVETFAMMHPEAGMKPVYCSEDSALRLLLADSLRCCVVTRKLLPNELDIIKAHTLGAKQALVATDAVALIVNKNCPDSLITLDEIKQIVTGKITRWEQLAKSSKKGTLSLVFDHSGSSTVRFMKDSLCAGRDITGNVYASDSGTNRSVIEMVQRDPDIIGVVGTNWLKEGV
ncbi:MAG: PstS family phosphate ABC transporter substrate-binding protein, partial [Alloprevotella sp.]